MENNEGFNSTNPINSSRSEKFSKLKGFWSRFVAALKRVFVAKKDDVHQFRKRLVYGILIGLAAAIVIVIIVFGIGIYKYEWNNKAANKVEKIIPYPAATVGVGVLFVKNYAVRVNSLEHYYNVIKQKPQSGYKKAILEQMIDQKILEQQARKYGIYVTDKEIDETYQQIVLSEGDEAQVKKILEELWGYDVNFFKSLIKEKLLEQKMRQEIPVSLHLQHVLFKLDANADANTQAEVLKKAENAKNEIINGADISSLAKQFSEDAATKDSGGDLGWYANDQIESQLSKDCSDKLSKMKVGTDIEVCRSQYGFNVIKITEKKGKIYESFTNWFNGIKAKTKIYRFVGQK